MNEIIEAQLETARRLLPDPPPRSRGKVLLLVGIGLATILLLCLQILKQHVGWQNEARRQAPPGASP